MLNDVVTRRISNTHIIVIFLKEVYCRRISSRASAGGALRRWREHYYSPEYIRAKNSSAPYNYKQCNITEYQCAAIFGRGIIRVTAIQLILETQRKLIWLVNRVWPRTGLVVASTSTVWRYNFDAQYGDTIFDVLVTRIYGGE